LSQASEQKTELRAAQYVRMSTERQQYSTQNQADKIQEYADHRGMEIVRTYADDGKSGLSIGGQAFRSPIAPNSLKMTTAKPDRPQKHQARHGRGIQPLWLAIDLSSMTNAQNQNADLVVLNLRNNAIIADPKPPQVLEL